nr:hypothetical protein 3 [Bacillaceae bacterium]
MGVQLKRNDTKDGIQYRITAPNGEPIDLTGTSIRFLMGKGNTLLTNAPATILDAENGYVIYYLTDTDTLKAGVFHAEFEVTYSDGKIKTYPSNGYINVNIKANLDAGQSTYIEDQIAYRVSDLQVIKNEIQAQIDQFVVDGVTDQETAQARVEADGTTNTTLKARLDKKEAEFGQGIQSLSSSLAQIAKKLPSVYVDDYAVGDGVTNDTLAFQEAVAIINAAGGGKLILSNKTYLVGLQDFAGATGKGYSYLGKDIITIQNCTRTVIIEGNGAKLKADSNLRFGSFDPVTGAVHNPTMPFTNYDYRADAYQAMVYLNGNKDVIVRDLELDGNSDNIQLGGLWGDTGRQCAGTGIRSYGNDKVIIENVNSHHHPLDGVIVKKIGLVETDQKNPHTLINVSSEYNARQGLSWSGGIGLTAIDCKFNHTGKGRFNSSPNSGVDIEAENSVCREGFFLNCEIINNTGNGVVTDSGDGGYTTFKNCTIWGTTSVAVWANKPHMVFEDCKIFGRIISAYGSIDPSEATKFIRCIIEDKAHPVYGMLVSAFLIDINGENILFDGCTFVNNLQRLITTGGTTTTEIFRNCKFIFKYDGLADKTSQAVFNGSSFENVTFSDEYITPPLTSYFIDIPGNTIKILGNVVVDATHTNWMSWSTGGGGSKGNIGSQIDKPQKFLAVHKRLYNSTYYGSLLIGSSNAMPTTGTFTKGDEIINDNPSELGTAGSKYIVSGWKRLTTGSNHVLNTDWLEMRNLTGN